MLMLPSFIWAGPRQQAWRLHNRLTGVPPTPTTLAQMESLITSGNAIAAAQMAMQNPYFYNLGLKNWFKKWSNVDDSPRVELNDYVATAVGLIRDDIPFDQVLYGDHLYTAPNVNIVTAYSPDSNDHYKELEENNVDLSQVLVRTSQSAMNGIADTAGVLTTRASGEAFFSAGTNRRVTRFTFMNYMCRDFEALHDITVPDFHVRKDVDRAPGGDSRTFRNKCVGCHAGQDALGGAFAYFDYVDGQLVHTPGQVAGKVNLNNLFNDGWLTTDDSWINLWSTGINANLGWKGAINGNGARAFGQMLARSSAFSQCMAQRVYEYVCLQAPEGSQMIAVQSLGDRFETEFAYNMKTLIAQTSTLCLGD